MKKILSLVMTLALATTLIACGNAGSQEQPKPSVSQNTEATVADSRTEENESEPENTDGDTVQSDSADETERQEESSEESKETVNRILIAYFSRTGENYSVGYIEKGNTHIIADMIAEQTDGDTFEISTVTPYPDAYDECTDIAQQERNENARPELVESLDNLDDYDVIFIGYPIWWSDMPMVVYTFLESYDFEGKTIVPFCTHEGSGLSSTEENIATVCPGAEILDGFSIRGSVAQKSQEEAVETVSEWLRQIGVIE